MYLAIAIFSFWSLWQMLQPLPRARTDRSIRLTQAAPCAEVAF
jgi:hypothetical protein